MGTNKNAPPHFQGRGRLIDQRLDVRGWWLIVAGLCVLIVSHVITCSRHDVIEIYTLMGCPEQQIGQMKKFSFLSGGMVMWCSLAFTLPQCSLLRYFRRFARRARA
ncbi:MAG: hypothetical protein HY301_06970 [Verrucomicrobia bacterium]|nr:hypothetical protein [Verrucomicrobiota bacterium]